MATAKIVRGQTVDWLAAFWEDDAETIPMNCVGATVSIVRNSTGAVIVASWLDQAQGKWKIHIDPLETKKMKPGRFGTFRVCLVKADGREIVYPDTDVLVI
jgi:hypothetical protein